MAGFVPDRDACLVLLDRAGCSPAVVAHARCVATLALALAEHARPGAVDAAVVEAGAMLHDIGRAFTHGRDHVWRGARFLEGERVDARVVRCVARHMGAGIDAGQADAWGWPSGTSYAPEVLEERIVSHADNLTFGTRCGSMAELRAKLAGRGLTAAWPRFRALHEVLARELGVDPDAVARRL